MSHNVNRHGKPALMPTAILTRSLYGSGAYLKTAHMATAMQAMRNTRPIARFLRLCQERYESRIEAHITIKAGTPITNPTPMETWLAVDRDVLVAIAQTPIATPTISAIMQEATSPSSRKKNLGVPLSKWPSLLM